MHEGKGPHYSRRTPGSKTFTGVGQEIVLVTQDFRAVWAVVRQRTQVLAERAAAGVEPDKQIRLQDSFGETWCFAISGLVCPVR
jgi:hypothetical protein